MVTSPIISRQLNCDCPLATVMGPCAPWGCRSLSSHRVPACGCRPELNPAERVFEQVRAQIEGAVYPTIADKVAAVEAILAELDIDPERVTSLTGWHWIAENLHRLPADNAA